MKRLYVLFLLLVVSAFGPALSAPKAEAGHVACGETIVANTVLDSDLACAEEGLIIGADNITLDLNGHTLRGPGLICNPCPAYDGIRISERTGVIIRNGALDGFVFGVRIRATNDSSLVDIEVRNSSLDGIVIVENSNNNLVKDCISRSSDYFGILINHESDKNTIEDCLVVENGFADGRPGIFIGGSGGGAASFENLISNSEVSDNAGAGIQVGGGSGDNTVSGNLVLRNGGPGILFGVLPPPLPVGNIITNNRIFWSGGKDILDETVGDSTAGTGNTYDGNRCHTSRPPGLCERPSVAPPGSRIRPN